MIRVLNYVAVLLFLCAMSAEADSWVSPEEAGIASPDGRVIVRIIPGDSLGEVYGFAGAEKGQHARALYYRLSNADDYTKYQETTLLNPIAPVFFAVGNDGALVTLDNWHNMGYGNAVTVYSKDGKVVKSYALADIYDEKQIQNMVISTSSIWWRCRELPVLNSYSNKLSLFDALGQTLEIDLNTGEIAFVGEHRNSDCAS